MLKSLKCTAQDVTLTNGYAVGYSVLPLQTNFIAKRNRKCRMFQVPDQNSKKKKKKDSR